MNTERIYDENGQGFIRVISIDNVEKVNPIEYYKTDELKRRAISIRDLLYANNPFLTLFVEDAFFERKAQETMIDFFKEIEQTNVHDNFIKLLKTTRKKEQLNLLKGMTLNSSELMALIFKSYNDFGFLYSNYIFENLPKGLEGKKLPKLFYLREDGIIDKVGETDLTDGELKNIIEHRKVIVSHFFEKDDFWHCFFLTYDGVSGRENWKSGQSHFHYISSSFGVSKEDFIESMRNGKYKSTPVHIDLLDFGNQSRDEITIE